MKARIAQLVTGLRRADVRVSVAEAMDAALAAASAGVERPVLRDALAAALIKDERDRPVFLTVFDRVFPPGSPALRAPVRRKRERRGSESGEGGTGSAAAGRGAAPRAPAAADDAREADPNAGGEDRRRSNRDTGRDAGDRETEGSGIDAVRRRRERELARLPFRAMSPADVEATATLVRTVAARVRVRWRRRLAPRPTGRLDFRRTIRAAVPRGGVPFERRFRSRRPSRPDLVGLCDLSVSAAVATQFFLSLLMPATDYFRRVHLYGYVDRLVEIEFVNGQVRPAAPIDLMARSDFGRVLKDLVQRHADVLGADTVLLVLGDARNNRLPARADLLAAARARVRRLLWLNPEPSERWNTGDSVIASYTPHADAVIACGTLGELERALAAVARW
jgi:uncharacterized protein with von Willebrand factor type A (vWA) domain